MRCGDISTVEETAIRSHARVKLKDNIFKRILYINKCDTAWLDKRCPAQKKIVKAK